jgi:phage terminase Nu1 subunit (DNA packaging protein)
MPDLHRMKQVEVAEVLGVSSRQVHNLVKEGMPRHAENGKTYYDAPECVAWYLARKVAEAESNAEPTSEWESKARLDSLRADLLDIELQRARGQVMPVEYAVSQLEGIGARLRTKMQILPTKWAPGLVGAQTIPEMATRLEVAVQDAMKALVTVADDLDLEEAA